MCFGKMEETGKKTTENSLPDWINSAAKTNVNSALELSQRPFTAYSGERVADLSPDQSTAFGTLRNLAATPNKYTGNIESLYSTFAGAPASTVSTSRLIDNLPSMDGSGPAGSIQDYMNPFIDATLAPTLRQLERSGATARNQIGAQATGSGAFGDARHGILEARQRSDEAVNASDLTGKAFSDAFMQALSSKNLDLNRLLDVAKTNAGATEAALARGKAGGDALMGLDKYNTGRGVDLANQLAAAGATERGVAQQKLDVPYQDFQAEQDWGQKMQSFLNSIIKGTSGSYDTTKTETTAVPNNSGYQMLAGLAAAFL